MRALATTGLHENNARYSVLAFAVLVMTAGPALIDVPSPGGAPGGVSLSTAMAFLLVGMWTGDRFVPIEGFSKDQWIGFALGTLAVLALIRP